MKKYFVFLLFCIGLLSNSKAQEIILLDSVQKNTYTPKQLGALHFIPDSAFATKWVATVAIHYSKNDQLSVFKFLDKACIAHGANAFQEYAKGYDSTSATYFWHIGLHAFTIFDIDKLPYLPPAIYVLNLSHHSLGTAIEAQSSETYFTLPPDTFQVLYAGTGSLLRLDGLAGSSFKSKRRRMEREFVFSAKGTPNRWSYKSWYSARKGIYVTLAQPIGEWLLFGMGYDWWQEEAPTEYIFPHD
ncbi:MAG: hypothetical protein LAT76_11885 [Schleiferiaceae bacterium]|nr:hypothetical protein [Schleiferiaceae bacterium]